MGWPYKANSEPQSAPEVEIGTERLGELQTLLQAGNRVKVNRSPMASESAANRQHNGSSQPRQGSTVCQHLNEWLACDQCRKQTSAIQLEDNPRPIGGTPERCPDCGNLDKACGIYGCRTDPNGAPLPVSELPQDEDDGENWCPGSCC